MAKKATAPVRLPLWYTIGSCVFALLVTAGALSAIYFVVTLLAR